MMGQDNTRLSRGRRVVGAGAVMGRRADQAGQRVSSGEQREQCRRDRAAQIITRAWPGDLGQQVLAVVAEHDAFGALAYKLDQAAQDGADPVAILREIDDDTLLWAITEADDPAAFLASRIGRAS